MYTGYPKTLNEQIAGYESEIIETFDIKVNNVIIAAGQNVLDLQHLVILNHWEQFSLLN